MYLLFLLYIKLNEEYCKYKMRLLHKGEPLCCFRDSASVTYGGMLPSDLTLSALRFILSAKSRQSCKQDCETVDFCNSLKIEPFLKKAKKEGGLSILSPPSFSSSGERIRTPDLQVMSLTSYLCSTPQYPFRTIQKVYLLLVLIPQRYENLLTLPNLTIYFKERRVQDSLSENPVPF